MGMSGGRDSQSKSAVYRRVDGGMTYGGLCAIAQSMGVAWCDSFDRFVTFHIYRCLRLIWRRWASGHGVAGIKRFAHMFIYLYDILNFLINL
jgi:hypothetical protein